MIGAFEILESEYGEYSVVIVDDSGTAYSLDEVEFVDHPDTDTVLFVPL